jgi:primosomal protein N'
LDTLSYFSSENFSIGTCITIPVRGRSTQGIVVATKPVSSTKTALKAATFSLRKIPPQTNVTSLSPQLLATVHSVHQSFPAQFGQILFALLPPEIRNGTLPHPHSTVSSSNEDATPQILIGTEKERFINYQSIIRSAFAHRGSVVFVVPTTPAVEHAARELSPGISDRVICFRANQSKAERTRSYEQFSNLTHTNLIITTPSCAYLDRTDITHIIVEGAGSSYYSTHSKPAFDHRDILKIYAKESKRSIIFGDSVVRTEEEFYRRNDTYNTVGESPIRLDLGARTTVVTQTDKPTKETPFTLFSPELAKRITTTIESRHNVFLFAARRGLAPVVACYDCGYIFRCPDSGTPYSLLRTHKNGTEERWFIASTSGKRIRAADVCAQCGSWRLRERGIGIQYIQDECQKLFPGTPIVVFDHTTATTHKKARAVIETFNGFKGAILIGTQMVLPYLYATTMQLSGIVSLDAVRAIPSWRADEMLFRHLITIIEHTEKECLIQTRTEPDDVILYATRGAVDRFYEDEIHLRQMLHYPPATTLILLSWQGSPTAVAATETDITTVLKKLGHNPQCYTNPSTETTKPLRHCLVRITGNSVPAPLTDYLRHLPPHISVAINPDRIV